MENEIRRKDLILFYRTKRFFLFMDEWLFYFLLVFMYHYGFTFFLILPIMIYGSIGIYTSYKNLDLIENKIAPIQQEIYAYQDMYSGYKFVKSWIQGHSSDPIVSSVSSATPT
jgi:hypothetical protein